MDVIEAMNSCRAIRYFTDDPISDDILDGLIHSATRAPNPGNSQGWDFVIITDSAIKSALSDSISAVIGGVVKGMEDAAGGADKMDAVESRMLNGALHLATILGDVPAIILVCGRAVYPAGGSSGKRLRSSGTSSLPAHSIERTLGRAPVRLPNLGGSLPNDAFAHILGLGFQVF